MIEEYEKKREKIIQELNASSVQSSVTLKIKDLGDQL